MPGPSSHGQRNKSHNHGRHASKATRNKHKVAAADGAPRKTIKVRRHPSRTVHPCYRSPHSRLSSLVLYSPTPDHTPREACEVKPEKIYIYQGLVAGVPPPPPPRAHQTKKKKQIKTESPRGAMRHTTAMKSLFVSLTFLPSPRFRFATSPSSSLSYRRRPTDWRRRRQQG